MRQAVLAYMEGEGLTKDVRRWFERSVPRPAVPTNWASRAMRSTDDGRARGFRSPEVSAERRSGSLDRKLVWIGGAPVVESAKRGQCRVILPSLDNDAEVRLAPAPATWLVELLRSATPAEGARYPALKDVRVQYPADGSKGFDSLLRSAAWKQARSAGLLLV